MSRYHHLKEDTQRGNIDSNKDKAYLEIVVDNIRSVHNPAIHRKWPPERGLGSQGTVTIKTYTCYDRQYPPGYCCGLDRSYYTKKPTTW